MRSILAITVSAIALTGCVTENSYNGSDRPVVEKKINNKFNIIQIKRGVFFPKR